MDVQRELTWLIRLYTITPDKFTTFGWDTGRKKIFEYENIDQVTLTIESEYAL